MVSSCRRRHGSQRPCALGRRCLPMPVQHRSRRMDVVDLVRDADEVGFFDETKRLLCQPARCRVVEQTTGQLEPGRLVEAVHMSV